jgi:hypothetical protein
MLNLVRSQRTFGGLAAAILAMGWPQGRFLQLRLLRRGRQACTGQRGRIG